MLHRAKRGNFQSVKCIAGTTARSPKNKKRLGQIWPGLYIGLKINRFGGKRVSSARLRNSCRLLEGAGFLVLNSHLPASHASGLFMVRSALYDVELFIVSRAIHRTIKFNTDAVVI